MSWEDRDGRRYYYRKHRIGQRVVSEYVGSGLLAEMVSEQDEMDRQQRMQGHEEFERLKTNDKNLGSELDSLIEATRACVRASLLISGFHPHRGQWRKKRYE